VSLGRKTAALTVGVLLVGIVAFNMDEVEVTCGGEVGTPAAFSVGEKVGSFGKVVHNFTEGDAPSALDIYRNVMGGIGTIEGWFDNFDSNVKTGEDSTWQTGWQVETEKRRAAALASCCQPAVTLPSSPNAPLSPAGTSGTAGEDGPDLAAAALRAAAPTDAKWLGQIPLGVSIAKYESGYDHDIANSSNHVGYWQISGPNADHLKLGDRTDPYVNAKYAYALWKGRGGTWAGDWSTYKTAQSHVGQYARYATISTAPPSGDGGSPVPGSEVGGLAPQVGKGLGKLLEPKTNGTGPGDTSGVGPGEEAPAPAPTVPTTPGPTPGCSPTAGAGAPISGTSVITWNGYHGSVYPREQHGNDQRVVKALVGFTKQAKVIATQELSDPDRKEAVNAAMDGQDFAFVGKHTSHEMFYDRKTYDLVADDTIGYYERGDNVEGPDQGDRYLVVMVLAKKGPDGIRTGQVETYVNQHQLPHIQSHGVLNPDEPHRIAVAIRGWKKLQEVVRQHAPLGPVIVMGDMNFDGDPNGMYAQVGLHMPDLSPTLRKRTIDVIATTGRMPDEVHDLGKFGSDHTARQAVWHEIATSSAQAAIGVGVVAPPSVPSQKVTMDGKFVSAITAAQIRLVESKTGKDLVLMQGGYGGGHIGASGTSHKYPGAVDVACSGADDCISKETAMRQAGFAAWARNVPGRSSVGSGSHVHGESLLDEGTKSAPQITGSWPNHGNGLSGYNNDPAPHPTLWPETAQLTGAR